MSDTKFNLPSKRLKVLEREAKIETNSMFEASSHEPLEVLGEHADYYQAVLARLIAEEEEFIRKEQAAFEVKRRLELP